MKCRNGSPSDSYCSLYPPFPLPPKTIYPSKTATPHLQLLKPHAEKLVRPRNIYAQLMRHPEHPLRLAHKLPSYEHDVRLRILPVPPLRHTNSGARLLCNLRLGPRRHGPRPALLDDTPRLLGLGDESHGADEELAAVLLDFVPDA